MLQATAGAGTQQPSKQTRLPHLSSNHQNLVEASAGLASTSPSISRALASLSQRRVVRMEGEHVDVLAEHAAIQTYHLCSDSFVEVTGVTQFLNIAHLFLPISVPSSGFCAAADLWATSTSVLPPTTSQPKGHCCSWDGEQGTHSASYMGG